MKIFKKNGEFNMSINLGNLLDTILIIVTENSGIKINALNLELRRCGFFIDEPELKKIVNKIVRPLVFYKIWNLN
jgi:hypothetical protein